MSLVFIIYFIRKVIPDGSNGRILIPAANNGVGELDVHKGSITNVN